MHNIVDNSLNNTCAVVYRIDDEFLICHSTGGPYWGLPKGMYDVTDPGFEWAAARELYEETGIVVNPKELTYKGTYPYNMNKNMVVFEYWAKTQFPIDKMSCISMFKEPYSGRALPEVDRFKYVTYDMAEKYLNRATMRILKDACKWTTWR